MNYPLELPPEIFEAVERSKYMMVIMPDGDHTGACKTKPCYCETVYTRPMTADERERYYGPEA